MYVCVSDEHRRKLQVGEVMRETRFVKIYALKQKSERENYLWEKKSQDKQRKTQQQFWYMREINFLDHERFPLLWGHSAKKCARLAIATRDASANHKIIFNKRTL